MDCEGGCSADGIQGGEPVASPRSPKAAVELPHSEGFASRIGLGPAQIPAAQRPLECGSSTAAFFPAHHSSRARTLRIKAAVILPHSEGFASRIGLGPAQIPAAQRPLECGSSTAAFRPARQAPTSQVGSNSSRTCNRSKRKDRTFFWNAGRQWRSNKDAEQNG